jgi:phospholipase/lecithinase/hemolysin
MMRRLVLSLLSLVAVITVLPQPATAADGKNPPPPRYESLYVFGDSLVDTGNDLLITTALGDVPAIPPSRRPNRTYYQGRFSNGPIAFEYLWALLNGQRVPSANGVVPSLDLLGLPRRGAVSFAFGGSTTDYLTPIAGSPFPLPGLRGQVELLRLALGGRRAPDRALYAILTGANDYIVEPPEQPADPVDVVQNITRAIARLYAIGARDVMVLGLPDLGIVPLVAAQGQKQSAALSEISKKHNALLKESLTRLGVLLPGLKLIPVDLNAVLQTLPPGAILGIPALDTFFPPPPAGQLPVSVCLFTNPQSCPSVPTFAIDPRFVFWDAQHPTTAVHQVLGQYLYEVLKQQ